MRVMLEMFANANQNIVQTQTFLIDKDFTEIAATEAVLPSVALQLCTTFHCIKAVQKKVSSLQLSREQKVALDALFRKLMYAKDADEFESISAEISQTSTNLHMYLRESWFPNKERCVHYLKNQHVNLGNTTTNRIEIRESVQQTGTNCQV